MTRTEKGLAMLTDPLLIAARYLAGQIRYRLAVIRSGQLDRGGLSLEWALIAVALCVLALTITAVLLAKLRVFEREIP
jgi:hypothetical protein